MPGPCSNPNGGKAEWEEMNELVCSKHKNCWPELPNKEAEKRFSDHEWVTARVWLAQRGKLRTGKTV